ncbi:hypothetical protein [Marinobacterium stanieri]|uniref:Uncharacterized protein n=1 Tax=Marinobacterium stanieri TaxID=49186 RepID=A0A1N6RNT1_9GAMM|nr:hypothetical protein [Marinobacterium stanieri]SIQ30540.1 hypothetical protein SAMN05421647_103442 [Marinobacterium stanieri]
MKQIVIVVGVAFASGIAYLSWQVVPGFGRDVIQPIASTMASVAGVLFGFVLASLTILASASGNKLVENTKKTKYFEKLVHRLHVSMGLLILVCLNFLAVLFVPESVMAPFMTETKLLSLVLVSGVFFFSMALFVFLAVWHEFSQFTKNM